MSSAIPTSTSVVESAVIRAPLSHVWHFIKLQDFSKFYSALEKSEYVKSANEETDVVKWSFRDGTVLEVKQEEHSVRTNRDNHSFREGVETTWNDGLIWCPQSLTHSITYSVISSQPALSYTSVVSTVRCFAVTSGELEGSTLVEWTGNFSSDADAGESTELLLQRRRESQGESPDC